MGFIAWTMNGYFEFPIPAGFIRYRNLVYFYYKYEGLLDYENAVQFFK